MFEGKVFYISRINTMHRFCLKQAAALAVAVVCCAGSALGAEQVLVENKLVRITSQDVEADLERIPKENRAEVLASKVRIRRLLENLLVTKTLAAQARSAGLDREPLLSKRMELAVDGVLSKEQINRAVAAVSLPDFDVRARELYRIDISKYTLPMKVHASHILVETKGRRTSEEAVKRIQEVRALAVEGKNFDELALEYSDDPSAKSNKGDLGFFAPGRMVKEFSDTAFAMKTPGEISEPVKTDFGYHIIKLHEIQPQKAQPFEAVKETIVQGLRDSYLADYRAKIVGDITSDPSIVFNEEAVDRFNTNLDAESVDLSKKEMQKK